MQLRTLFFFFSMNCGGEGETKNGTFAYIFFMLFFFGGKGGFVILALNSNLNF